MNYLFGCSKLQPAELWDSEMTLWYFLKYPPIKGFQDGANGKESTCQCRRCKRWGFEPWVRKIPSEGNGNPLLYSCLENSRDRGAWWATLHCAAKSWMWQHTQSTSFCSLFSGHSRRSRIALLSLVEENPIQFSSVMSDSLWPHGLQHTRPSCPLPTPGVYSNSCPLSQWYHPTILSSVIPFSSCLQSFPASESFQMSQFFAWSG